MERRGLRRRDSSNGGAASKAGLKDRAIEARRGSGSGVVHAETEDWSNDFAVIAIADFSSL